MRTPRLRGDHGAVTSELVIVLPVLLTFLMLIIQVGLTFHAVAVASAAAQEGSRMAAMEGEQNRITAGADEAEAFVDSLAPNLFTDYGATAHIVENGNSVEVVVQGDVKQVTPLPFPFLVSVNERSESVIEEFRPADDDPPSGS